MRRFALIIMVLGATLAMNGRQLTPDEALSLARGNVAKMKVMAAPAKGTPSLVYTATSGDDNTLYVFNNADGAGFLVVAADDVASPLLGYADAGSFDPSQVPPQMKWWLSQYSDEIGSAIADGEGSAQRRYSPRKETARTDVQPITKTLWNQDSPFNNQCPNLTSSQGLIMRAVTGCVATAMAQVMKVWNWPATGQGSNSYSFTYLGNSYSESMDFGATTFDWADMLNDYTGSTSTTANDAVATLMKACGVGVNMSYGLASTGGSGAASFNAAKALVNYFNYDKGITYLQREYYTIDDWADIIYNELAAGRAVLYGGQSSEGGHEFVCDGYSTDDYFHFNWGWGGMSNGYFKLTALDPDNQGIGGSGNGYNMNQDIIIGIQPPQAGSQIVPSMALMGTFMPQQSTYQVGDGETIVFGNPTSTLYYSQSVGEIDATLGVKLTDESGNTQYVASETSSDALPPQAGWYAFAMTPSQLPQGNYTVSPAFQSGGQWYDVKTSINNAPVMASVSPSQVVFTTTSNGSNIEVVNCTELTPIYIGQSAEFTVDVEATGNFYGEVMPALVSGNSIVATGTPKGLSYEAGDHQSIDWVMKFSGDSLVAGDYSLVFISPSGVGYSAEYPVTVNAKQTTTPRVDVTSVVFENASGSGTQANPYLINPGNLSATVTIEGVTGYWADNVMGMLFSASNGRSVTSFGDEFIGVDAGESRTFTLSGDVDGLTPGATYMFVPWGSTVGQFSGDITYIQVVKTTGVSSVDGDVDSGDVTVYSLTGVAVKHLNGSVADATAGLAPGYYIVSTPASTLRIMLR